MIRNENLIPVITVTLRAGAKRQRTLGISKQKLSLPPGSINGPQSLRLPPPNTVLPHRIQFFGCKNPMTMPECPKTEMPASAYLGNTLASQKVQLLDRTVPLADLAIMSLKALLTFDPNRDFSFWLGSQKFFKQSWSRSGCC